MYMFEKINSRKPFSDIKCAIPVMWFAFIIWIFSPGCSTDDSLNERSAGRILERNLQDSCILTHPDYTMLLGKPEFQKLADSKLCTIRINVINIDHHSETEATVRFTLTKSAHERNLNRFLDAWDAMEARLSELTPRKIPDPVHGVVLYYSDPYDNKSFVGLLDDANGVFDTPQWKRLLYYRENIEKLLDDKTSEEEMYSLFVRGENGWDAKVY